MRVTVVGRPRPKARPRPGKHGKWYVPSSPHQEILAYAFLRHRGEFPEGAVHVACEFHVHRGKLPDGDNCEKLVWDALQDAGVIADDQQVKSWSGRVIACEDGHERTVVTVSRID
jgi:Holliday junction resolvase RusA-like endonuclease